MQKVLKCTPKLRREGDESESCTNQYALSCATTHLVFKCDRAYYCPAQDIQILCQRDISFQMNGQVDNFGIRCGQAVLTTV